MQPQVDYNEVHIHSQIITLSITIVKKNISSFENNTTMKCLSSLGIATFFFLKKRCFSS